MFAKSISELSPIDRVAAPLPRLRKIVTLAVFFASLSALILLLHERYGIHFMESAFDVVQTEASAISARVLPQPYEAVVKPEDARHAALAEYLAKRFKVAQLSLIHISEPTRPY